MEVSCTDWQVDQYFAFVFSFHVDKGPQMEKPVYIILSSALTIILHKFVTTTFWGVTSNLKDGLIPNLNSINLNTADNLYVVFFF